MAYQSAKIEMVEDNIVRVHHPELVEPSTYLTAQVSASGTTLTVENNAGFSDEDLLVFEGTGIENAEIKQISASPSAGTSISVNAVTFTHAINTKIQKILFDQVEISGASTATSSKTVIATVNLMIGDKYTDYEVAGTTYNFYFARYYNSQDSTPYWGEYSDAIPATDFETNTVGFIRRSAFANVGETFDGNRWTDTWVYDQIFLCEEDLVMAKPQWGQLTVYDADMGDLTEGLQSVALPSDIANTKTDVSIKGLRIENNENIRYIKRPVFERLMIGVVHSQIATQVEINDTTLVLDDSNDFADDGSFNIAGTSSDYTDNTRSTDTLSGVDIFTVQILVDVDVWQGITFGEPRQYTVNDGRVYFVTPPDSTFEGRNIWIDYIKGATKPNSDGDTVIFNNAQVYISWLEMAIKKEKANGVLRQDDVSFIMYERRKQKLIETDILPTGLNIIPEDIWL